MLEFNTAIVLLMSTWNMYFDMCIKDAQLHIYRHGTMAHLMETRANMTSSKIPYIKISYEFKTYQKRTFARNSFSLPSIDYTLPNSYSD